MISVKTRLKKIGLASFLLIFLLGSVATLGVQKYLTANKPCEHDYDLLNPDIRCDGYLPQGEWNYEELRDVLSKKKEELKSSGTLDHISIYFRDLDNGPRFGIGEYDKFQPASLTKLPVLIAYLHLADLYPSILEKQLSFIDKFTVNENAEQPDETIKAGTPYSVKKLLTKMIVYSDNYSYELLTREMNASPKMITYYTFRDLDVLRMMLSPKADFVSIQSYASLFAILYNTGYLSRGMSQFALQLLSQTTFKEGLVAGVPDGVIVAHKFGHRILKNEDQLHDCGIVYHPSMNYILCVMTSGPSYENEKSAIAEVSHIVYDAVSTLKLSTASKK